MDSCSYAKAISAIHTVRDRALAKAFRSTAVYSTVKEALQKCLSEPQSIEVVSKRMIDAPASTVHVAESIKHEVEKYSHKKTMMEYLCNKLDEAVEGKNIKVEERILTKNMNSGRSPSP